MSRYASAFLVLVLALVASLAPADEKEPSDDARSAAAKAESAEEQIENALGEKTSFTLEETPLREFAEQLRMKTGVNVLIDRKALDDLGIADDTPLSGELREVSLRSALNIVLDGLDLTWMVENGALLITTPEESDSRLSTQVYNVKDLIAAECGDQECYEAEPLIHVITATIRPDTWAAVGGPGAIQAYGETLTISQTGEIHREVAALLAALRKSQGKAAADASTPPHRISIPLDDAGKEEFLAALEKPISLELQETPLAELPALLEEELGIQAVIDRRALDDVGLAAEVPLSLTVTEMIAQDALRHLLRPYGLVWIIHDEVLQITSEDEAAARLELRVYPVRDLCQFALDADRLTQPAERSVDALTETIMYTVAPDAWDQVGGPGAIAPLARAGVLVISQTADVHSKIEDLLWQLRKRLAEEPEAPVAAAKAGPDVLKLVVYDLPQPLPLQNLAPQQQGAAGGAEQPNLGGGGGLGGGGFFQFGGFGGSYATGTPIPSDDLVEIVTALAEPESWSREGVYIKAVPGRLIVRQSTAVHRRIKSLLVQLGLRSAWDFDGFGGSSIPVVGQR